MGTPYARDHSGSREKAMNESNKSNKSIDQSLLFYKIQKLREDNESD